MLVFKRKSQKVDVKKDCNVKKLISNAFDGLQKKEEEILKGRQEVEAFIKTLRSMGVELNDLYDGPKLTKEEIRFIPNYRWVLNTVDVLFRIQYDSKSDTPTVVLYDVFLVSNITHVEVWGLLSHPISSADGIEDLSILLNDILANDKLRQEELAIC